MQNVKPGDHMAASAKSAIDTALADAKAQRVGSTPTEAPAVEPAPAGTPSAAAPAPTPA